MRYDKNRLTLIGVIAALVVILLVLVIVAVVGMDSSTPTDQPDVTTKPVNDGEQNPEDPLKTPYGHIVFPEDLTQYLKVKRTDKPQLRLDFTAVVNGKEQELFAVWFGPAQSPAQGQVVAEDGTVAGVYVAISSFVPDDGWTAEQITIVTQMQEALNDVMESLNVMPLGSPVPDYQEPVQIETPYGKLYFPGQWKQQLKTTVDQSDGYEVVFSAQIKGHDVIALFAVNFGGSKGTVVHTITAENGATCEVRLRTFPLELDGWSDADQAAARAMQEDLNYLLTKLREE